MHTLPLPIVLLALVFLLTIFRKIGKLFIPIWFTITVAATIVLVAGKITVYQAVQAINFDVLLYLFGVFVIGIALEHSNYLELAMLRLFKRAKSGTALIKWLIVFSSFVTMLLMNDTAAIVGVPAILILTKKTDIPPLPLLLTLAYCLTISSVTSPIANPQNLLIASQISKPFVTFFHYLFIPTLINSFLLFFYMSTLFHKELDRTITLPKPSLKLDTQLARLVKLSIAIMLLLVAIQIGLSLISFTFNLPFSAIALVSCSPILLFSNKRKALLKKIDWHTLLFFFSLFIFIESVWLSHYFQNLVQHLHLHLTHPLTITGISLLLSQLISNVPLVALYLPLLKQAATEHYLFLAMASTMAGNLFILGAASNIIIIQNMEKRAQKAFSFWQFSLYGIPLCLVNVGVYYWFLT